MLLPSTHLAAVLLLLAAFICLGSWANTFKAAGWRFELFSYDFAVGAIIAAAVAAWTLGTLGSELSFNDRIAVAGLRSQAFAVGAGFLFSLGNILLIATMSLIGITAAFPLVISVALIVAAFAQFSTINIGLLLGGVLLLIVAAVCAIQSRWQKPGPERGRKDAPPPVRKSTKGLLTGIMGGVLIGGSVPLTNQAFWGDLGLGAYAGMLMFCTGLLISTVLFNFFFLNIAIEGTKLTLRSYITGGVRRHLWGALGGAMWSGGTIALYLAQSTTHNEAPAQSTAFVAAEGSVLLAMAWGWAKWHEFARSAPYKRVLIGVCAAAFAGALACLAFRLP